MLDRKFTVTIFKAKCEDRKVVIDILHQSKREGSAFLSMKLLIQMIVQSPHSYLFNKVISIIYCNLVVRKNTCCLNGAVG